MGSYLPSCVSSYLTISPLPVKTTGGIVSVALFSLLWMVTFGSLRLPSAVYYSATYFTPLWGGVSRLSSSFGFPKTGHRPTNHQVSLVTKTWFCQKISLTSLALRDNRRYWIVATKNIFWPRLIFRIHLGGTSWDVFSKNLSTEVKIA